MKRSQALIPLSHDHQHALDAALRLRRADEDTLAAAVAHFLAFFEREGAKHFAIEERHVLPALDARSDTTWAAGVERVLADHRAIRDAAAALGTHQDVAAARELGERLNAHVRFEERELFDHLERRLDAQALARVGAAIARAEAAGVEADRR